jgi:hypothetical protein
MNKKMVHKVAINIMAESKNEGMETICAKMHSHTEETTVNMLKLTYLLTFYSG